MREEAEKTEAARSQIRNAIKTSKEKVDIYYSTKNAGVIQERQQRIRKEKDLIYELEREAQSLESAEDDLIKRLQMLQNEERSAFAELENAMIVASLSKQAGGRRPGNQVA